MFDDEPISVPACLVDAKGKADASKYCAPIYIARLRLGLLFGDQEEFDFEFADADSVRNGTLTFLEYDGEYFTVTCAHVLKSLHNANKGQVQNSSAANPINNIFGFYTPVRNDSIHFNYDLMIPPPCDLGIEPDVAVARVNLDYINRVGCQPLTISNRVQTYEFALAYGYPETARFASQSETLGTLSTVGVACVSALESKADGSPRLSQEVSDAHGVNCLSGMSGGPILGVNAENFDILGLVKCGYDIEPSEDGVRVSNYIHIEGQSITEPLFKSWLPHIPSRTALQDFSVPSISQSWSS